MKTVKELKEYLNTLPEDTLLIFNHKDGEYTGYLNNVGCRVATMSERTKTGYCHFENFMYKYNVYQQDENGKLCLIIY